MDKRYIIDLLKSKIGCHAYGFSCNLLDYTFTIEDCNADNTLQIEKLFLEYIHPSSGTNLRKFHYFIKNIEDISLVEKFYELKGFFGKSTKIQTFKDNTYHEAYFLFDGSINIFYPEECDDYFILSHGKDYYFVCKKNMNTYLLRILREIYFRNSENLGDVVYHGGGFEIKKNGVMVCGDKAKGKTTVILEELKKGSNYLANDRVIISHINQNEYLIKYLPLSMRIGIGTISRTPCISEIVSSYHWIRNQSPKVLNYPYHQEQDADEFGSAEKLEITSKEIHEIFKINLVEFSPLKAIVFPDIDTNFYGIEVLSCEPSQASKLILEQCMTPIDENWITPWLFQRDKNNDELKKHAEKFTNNLVQNVKSYIIHFGLDAYKNWDMKLF
jgi:hypothetical protein